MIIPPMSPPIVRSLKPQALWDGKRTVYHLRMHEREEEGVLLFEYEFVAGSNRDPNEAQRLLRPLEGVALCGLFSAYAAAACLAGYRG